MHYWVFSIAIDVDEPELGSGWVRARTSAEALAMIAHDDAQVIEVPDDTGFPSEASGMLFWERRAPSLMN